MRRGSWCWTAALVAAGLGCTSPEGAAQEEAEAEAPATRPLPGDPEAEDVQFRATVSERGREQPFVVTDAKLFVPEVSLFGSGGGEVRKAIVLRKGAAEIRIPFYRIARLVVGEEREDRLEVVVAVRPDPDDPEGKVSEYQGTVKSSLELRGTYADSGLETIVKLRNVERVAFEPVE